MATMRPTPLQVPVPAPPRYGDGQAAVVIGGLVVVGTALIAVAFTRPALALAVPFLMVGGFACWRRPAAALTAVFLLTGMVGTLSSLTPIPAVPITEYLLACLWLGAIGTFAVGRRRAPLWLWPGLIAPGLYIGLTVLSIPLTDSLGNAIEGFRLSIWYMAAFLLVAIAPWPAGTTQKMAKGLLAVTVVVGAYCTFRYFVGASAGEDAFARATAADTPASVGLRFFGSFLSANQLAAWMAAVIPVQLALLLGWKGGWRLVAFVGLGLCAFCVLASDVRVGTLAAAGGCGVVIGIYAFARSFPETRIAHALAAVFAVCAFGFIGYSLTVAKDPESVERFENILNPSSDYAYQVRQNYWAAAWDTIEEHPFGSGLGTSGAIGTKKSERGPAAGLYNIDSSFLKIALEQGLPVMIFFAASMIALFFSLAWRAITITDRKRATLGIGACGTLFALMTLLYAGLYIENVAALMAWLLIGMGAAQFTRLDDEPAEQPAEQPV